MERGHKILVVDDDKDVRCCFSRMLEFYGYQVVEAASGEDALEKIEREKIGLTIIDVEMPGLGGMETARKIKARDKDHPVILMSGYAKSYIEGVGFPEGVRAFLKKPVLLGDLLAKVKSELHYVLKLQKRSSY